MKSWYDKKGRYCYGRACGGIKDALESPIGFTANSRYIYTVIEDAGGLSIWRRKTKKTVR